MLQAQVEIEYDPIKNMKNIAARGISFELVREFDFETAVFFEDTRKDYGESRLIYYGYIFERLHVLCLKLIDGKEKKRIISLRKANPREIRQYEKLL